MKKIPLVIIAKQLKAELKDGDVWRRERYYENSNGRISEGKRNILTWLNEEFQKRWNVTFSINNLSEYESNEEMLNWLTQNGIDANYWKNIFPHVRYAYHRKKDGKWTLNFYYKKCGCNWMPDI